MNNKYERERKKRDPNYKLIKIIRSRIWLALKGTDINLNLL
jgi:hypothetical protein